MAGGRVDAARGGGAAAAARRRARPPWRRGPKATRRPRGHLRVDSARRCQLLEPLAARWRGRPRALLAGGDGGRVEGQRRQRRQRRQRFPRAEVALVRHRDGAVGAHLAARHGRLHLEVVRGRERAAPLEQVVHVRLVHVPVLVELIHRHRERRVDLARGERGAARARARARVRVVARAAVGLRVGRVGGRAPRRRRCTAWRERSSLRRRLLRGEAEHSLAAEDGLVLHRGQPVGSERPGRPWPRRAEAHVGDARAPQPCIEAGGSSVLLGLLLLLEPAQGVHCLLVLLLVLEPAQGVHRRLREGHGLAITGLLGLLIGRLLIREGAGLGAHAPPARA